MTDQIDNTLGTAAPAEPEKMIPQSEVNRLMGHARAKGAETARKEAEEQYQRNLEAMKAQQTVSPPVPQQQNNQVDIDSIAQKLVSKFQEQKAQQEAHGILNNFSTQYSKAQESYPDFEDAAKHVDFSKYSDVVRQVVNFPNGADIMYDLVKNPQKLGNLGILAERSPELARMEFMKLSKSISDNQNAQAAAKNQSVNAPLSQMKSSRVASNNNGKMDFSDLKKQSWLKG